MPAQRNVIAVKWNQSIPIAGRIPGALNFDWEQLKKEGVFNLDDAVKEQLHNVVEPTEEVTVYCGSGVTAAPLYAMLKHNGYEKVRCMSEAIVTGFHKKARSRERI